MYLYIFNRLATNSYKIGITNNITRRLREVQNGSDEPLVISAYIECQDRTMARETEREIHKLLTNGRLSGEWYRLDDADLDRLEMVYDLRRDVE